MSGLNTVAVDFDGVIAVRNEDWSQVGDPIPGAFEGLRFLMSRFPVMIFTARKVTEVIMWLKTYDFPTDTDNGSPEWDTMGVLLVTNRKLPAAVYLDDKAVRFWSWSQAIAEVEFLTNR